MREKSALEMQSALRYPVIAHGAEYLVMGLLMRRNILTYKAPPGNEGYDLICIHPDPRHTIGKGQKAQVRIQVKSRYASDCDRGFPVKPATISAFDFLVIAFLNVGNFLHRRGRDDGRRQPEFFTLPAEYVSKNLKIGKTWTKVMLGKVSEEITPFASDDGFEQIATVLGVEPLRRRVMACDEPKSAH